MPLNSPVKAPVAGSALPEHAQQEGRKQRRVDEGEHQLEHVHDVVKARRHIGRRQRQRDAEDGGHAAHPQVVLVARGLVDIGLVDVIRPHRIEGGDVARHA